MAVTGLLAADEVFSGLETLERGRATPLPLTCRDAADAGRTIVGRVGPDRSKDVRDDEREIVAGDRKLKDVGGAVSFDTRSVALRLVRGATEGGLVLATAIDSRRLWPGTPSNVSEEGAAPAVDGRPLGFAVGTACPILRAAALVILGATTGGAVEAT